ncbi:MAG: amidohydrolase family protein [Desulfotomaculales bacterium]
MGNLLVRGATVLTMDPRGTVYDPGEVAVGGDAIIHVGPPESVPADFRADRVIEGRGLVLLPGLVNAHTHAAMTLFRGYADDLPLMEWLQTKIWPVEARLEPEDVYWGTLLACVEMIRSGTTAFADMYFHMEEAARAVLDAGIRASLSRGLIGVAPGANRALEDGVALVREFHGAGEGRLTCMLGPHAPYTCPPDYLERVRDQAARLGVGVHIHLSETEGEVAEIRARYGCSPVRLLERTGLLRVPVLAAHCVHLDDDDVGILAARGVSVAHNPESNMKLASGVAPVAQLLDAGVNVALGTDGAASNNNLDLFEEMRAAALLQKVARRDPTVLPAHRVLEMPTINGARALGLADRIGSLEPGKKADFILVDTAQAHLTPRHSVPAHLVYAARGPDVVTVVVDGRIVMENRAVLTVDEEKLFAEVTARAERLTGKATGKFAHKSHPVTGTNRLAKFPVGEGAT